MTPDTNPSGALKVADTAPERIYLVIGEDCPPDARWDQLDEVTWCEDNVDGNGIEYVRASPAPQATGALSDEQQRDAYMLRRHGDEYTYSTAQHAWQGWMMRAETSALSPAKREAEPVALCGLEAAFEAELDRLKWDSDYGGCSETGKVFKAFRAVAAPLARVPLTVLQYNAIPELCAIKPSLYESVVRAIERAHGIAASPAGDEGAGS